MWLLGPTLRRSAYGIGRTRVTRPPCGRGRQERTITILGRLHGLSATGQFGTAEIDRREASLRPPFFWTSAGHDLAAGVILVARPQPPSARESREALVVPDRARADSLTARSGARVVLRCSVNE